MPKTFIIRLLAAALLACSVTCPALTEDTCLHASISKLVIPANHPKIGLALGGVAAHGVAHAGVLAVFERAGIPIDYIAGASSGAIIGGLYCAGVPAEQIEENILNKSLVKPIMYKPLYLTVLEEPLRLAPRLVGHRSYIGLYDGRKLLKYLNKEIPACNQDISSLPIPFRAVALNLLDGKIYGIDKGNLGLAIVAAEAIPSLRQPVPMNGKLFVEAGLMNNLPVDIVKQMGADIVIAVNVDESVPALLSKNFKVFGATPRRLLSMELAQRDAVKMKSADIVIHPNIDGIGLLSIRKGDLEHAMNAGEEAAIAALPAIQAALNPKLTLLEH